MRCKERVCIRVLESRNPSDEEKSPVKGGDMVDKRERDPT